MDKALQSLAKKIDEAIDAEDASAINTLIKKCEGKALAAKGAKKVILFFFVANCYSGLSSRNRHSEDYAWNWFQHEKLQEVLHLRRAIIEPGFTALHPVYKCKIFTNLGNSLNHFGRCVEAIKYWDFALEINPNLAMALGNKGEGLIYYGRSLYDYGHEGVFIEQANEALEKALSKDALWDSGQDPLAHKTFEKSHNKSKQYLDDIDFDKEFEFDQFSLGDSEAEVAYRMWCLSNRLYLSPLNDILTKSVAARDVLHLPSHTYKVSERPRFPSYFNLLKQEYVSARFMVYEAISLNKAGIADNDVLLLNAFDGVQFGHQNELLKSSFRITYSIFDKVAMFLNDYYSLNIPAKRVSMRGIWGATQKGGEFELRECFKDNKNWSLRGLYYLTKDIYDPDFMDSSIPEAKDLAALRNFAEHRFLSIQEYSAEVEPTDFHDYITIDDFIGKNLKMLGMAREALIYLSLAMHREEGIRDKERDPAKVYGSVSSVPINK